MHEPTGSTHDPLTAWLAHAGLHLGLRVGPFHLRAVERPARDKDRGAVLVFRAAEPEATLRLLLLATDSERKAFVRTPSLDLLHEPVDDALLRPVGTVLRVVEALVRARDRGRFPPPPVDDAPAKGPAPEAPPEPVAEVATSSDGAPAGEGGASAYGSGSAVEPPDPPALRVGDGPHFLDWRFVDAADLSTLPDAIRDMVDGRLGGLIVRRAFDPAHMARAVAAIEASEDAFTTTHFPARFGSRFLGRALDGSDPQLSEYLPIAARFHEATREAFASGPDYRTRLEELLAQMAGGRRVAVPRFRDGREYACSTVRVLPPGGQIGTHCGNEASTRPAYTHLNGLVDGTDQVSFFLTMQAPEAGGELVVYSLQWKDIDQQHLDHGHTHVDGLLPAARWEAYHPEAGDLLLFDGGRYFHRVSVVRGARTRFTIGGFMMFSRDGSTLHYWS